MRVWWSPLEGGPLVSHQFDAAGNVSEKVGGKWMHRRAPGRLKGDNAVIIAASSERVSPRWGGRRCQTTQTLRVTRRDPACRPPAREATQGATYQLRG